MESVPFWATTYTISRPSPRISKPTRPGWSSYCGAPTKSEFTATASKFSSRSPVPRAAAVAALVALRNVAGEQIARRAAPFVVIAPAAIWHTNADTLYAGVALCAVAFVVIATSSSGRRGDALAIAGGTLFGGALLLTYGVAALALPMVVLAVARHRLRILVVAGTATAATLALPALWGFSWVAGLQATKQQYDVNLATVRPYWYFVVANLAVFSLALGPAVIVGLAWLRDRRRGC